MTATANPVDRYVWTKPQRYEQPSAAERFQALTADFDRQNRVGTQHTGIYFFGVMRSKPAGQDAAPDESHVGGHLDAGGTRARGAVHRGP